MNEKIIMKNGYFWARNVSEWTKPCMFTHLLLFEHFVSSLKPPFPFSIPLYVQLHHFMPYLYIHLHSAVNMG